MITPTYDIVGIGNAIVDILVHTDEAFLIRHGMNKGGMQLVESSLIAALRAELLSNPQYLGGGECSGGSVANTIAAMAQMGSRTCFLGRVADDALGTVFTHDIRKVGVAFTPTPATSGKPTACCVICVTPDGERTMNTFIGASAEFTPEDMDAAVIANASYLYIEGYLWDAAPAKAAITKAIEIARASGVKIAFSASDTFCVHRHHEEFLALIRDHIDVLFANEDEALALYPDMTIEAAASTLSTLVETFAITRSSQPAIIGHHGVIEHVAATHVEHVVDATGAGDLFAAGFLHGLIERQQARECAMRGHAMASHIIGQLGARSTTLLTALVA